MASGQTAAKAQLLLSFCAKSIMAFVISNSIPPTNAFENLILWGRQREMKFGKNVGYP